MSALFSPIALSGLALDNRIVISPMCQYSAIDGAPQTWHLVHCGGLMVSGAGLVILEATAVEAVGRISHGCLGLYNDAQEVAFARLVEQMRSLSKAKLGLQLAHAGRRASCRTVHNRWRGEPLPPEENAWKPVGPSPLAYDIGWQTPDALDHDGIQRIRDAFATAARRANRAGFDLIEIHAAHGYLLHNFLSPITNRRSDSYGGSLENRMRLPLEVAQAVREAFPTGKPIGVRINSTDWNDEGLDLDDAVAFASRLKSLGIDYAVMSAGNLAPHIQIPPAHLGHQVHFAKRVRRETGLTTMAVGFIVDPRQAEDIISSGSADLVAIARAAIDNPRWGWHAAAALDHEIDYPAPYIRARPNHWGGFALVHPAGAAATEPR